jgi:hypothetical protein
MHFNTRLARFSRNAKYNSKCVGRHQYRANGMCINCGKVHVRRAIAYKASMKAAQNINAATQKLTDNLRSAVSRVIETGN